MSSGAAAPYAHLEVNEVGALSLVQDLGRPGRAGLGVSPSGAADRGAHALGARLLGQDPALASIEVVGGLSVRTIGSVTAVVTGARCAVTIDGRPVGTGAPFLVRHAQLLRIGLPTAGLRSYLGVRGGIAVAPVLGSRSSDTLSGLGPAPLNAGDVLPVAQPVGEPGGELLVDVAPVAAPAIGSVDLAVLPGPRPEWLADAEQLTSTAWTVAADSDRVGLRLDGPALQRSRAHGAAEVPSEGVVRGAVQVPADGLPMVFLADHPVTGGYPVVAVLTAAACDLAAQLVPGQPVRLRMRPSQRSS
ncbi:MAG: biotin-dependent carboxyltransferase family protein [Pedococcus sp.]